MPENYRGKEPLYNAGSGNTYTGMPGNALPEYALKIGAGDTKAYLPAN